MRRPVTDRQRGMIGNPDLNGETIGTGKLVIDIMPRRLQLNRRMPRLDSGSLLPTCRPIRTRPGPLK